VASLVGWSLKRHQYWPSAGNAASARTAPVVADYATHPAFTERERAARLRGDGDDLAERHQRLSVRRASSHFTPRQIVEITAQAAFENYRARPQRSLRIEDDGFTRSPSRANRPGDPAILLLVGGRCASLMSERNPSTDGEDSITFSAEVFSTGASPQPSSSDASERLSRAR